ncbi:gamma-glutamyltransferase [Undibacterium sp. TJN25]|uniref:gamma-glutamyltransferase n=1 Tax=Undibacterium sp. TJN25 TaxID=3413056 RepID=UPI003BF0EB55
MRFLWTAVFVIGNAALAGYAGAQDAQHAAHYDVAKAPEIASGYTSKNGWTAQKYMVVAANPLAAEAGYRMLKQGGSAIDAAVATQMVLGLVEPQSSGIGGGAFMLHFDGKAVQAFDGRETAPAAATEKLFQDANGKPLPFYDAVIGGRSVGVPGVLRMLELAHRQHGTLPWKSLFVPAIQLAEKGFAVSPRLFTLLQDERFLKKDPVALAYFYNSQGQPWPVGHILKNPELARTLRAIAEQGTQAFYAGRIAQDMVDKVHAHASNPGTLALKDLADYQAKAREAVCADFEKWTVCGMPPPSSGGIAIAQMLGILENTGIRSLPPTNGELNPEAVHLFTEAGRLAYADRERYIADTDFVPLPGNSFMPLLDKTYLAGRAALISDKSMGSAKPGTPPGMQVAWGADHSPELPSTSHMSIVDGRGQALSMTTSVEDAFGSRQMVDGFLLNNQLTDFSALDKDANGPIANRVQPGKRPRSAMSPTLVFDRQSKQFVMAIGSPGGSVIINYVMKVLIGNLDWGLDLQQAINLPNFGSRNGATELERGRFSDATLDALKAKGHNIRIFDQTSGLHGITRTVVNGKSVLFGAADPRREGVARGD